MGWLHLGRFGPLVPFFGTNRSPNLTIPTSRQRVAPPTAGVPAATVLGGLHRPHPSLVPGPINSQRPCKEGLWRAHWRVLLNARSIRRGSHGSTHWQFASCTQFLSK